MRAGFSVTATITKFFFFFHFSSSSSFIFELYYKSVYFYSEGAGDLNIQASCSTLLSEIYSLEDLQFYASSMQKIKNNFINDTSVSGRTIYLSSFTFNSDVALEFKFKNTIPSNWLIGFGSNGTSLNNKGLIFTIAGYNSGNTSVMWLDTSNTPRDASIRRVLTSSEVVKITTENIHKIYWYTDNTAVAYRDTHTGTPLGLRFDVFDNQDYDIDYIKVKPL